MPKNDNDELVKKITKKFENHFGELNKKITDLQKELTRGRSKQFDTAVQYIIDSEIVPRQEVIANFRSFNNSYYMDKFKKYAENYDIFTIRVMTRGHPEIFIHANNLKAKKFVKLWNYVFLNKGAIPFNESELKITPEEKQFFQEFAKKYLNKFVKVDENGIYKR